MAEQAGSRRRNVTACSLQESGISIEPTASLKQWPPGSWPTGDFRLENVARPVGIYAVTSDGLTIPNVRKLEGKGEITIPSVGGVTAGDATSRARRRSSMAAAVGLIAVGVALGWVGGLIGSSDISTDTTGLAVPSTTAPTTSEPTDTGSPVVGMASMDCAAFMLSHVEEYLIVAADG